MKQNIILPAVAIILFIGLFVPYQQVFAGQSGCQAGEPTDYCNSPNPPPRCNQSRQQKEFAAAQAKYEQNQPPTSGTTMRGGDSETRSNWSFFASISILFGGVWALFVLLRQRFGKNLTAQKSPLPRVLNFVCQPSFAVSALGVLFAAVIVGSQLTAPISVTAEKRDKPDKSKMTGLMNPSSKPVFKTAQQIGGDGYTQIGSPVFDAAGNRYVRGGFTGTLTIGVTTLTATRDFDLFVAKYDTNGNALWARQGSGMTTGAINIPIEGATALAVDAGGNVYIGGSFVKTLTLQGGANANITLTDGATGADVNKVNYESFVAKYDGSGNLLWAKGGNSGSPKHAADLETGQNGIDQIVFDASGNPYVAGFVSGTNFFGSPFTNTGQSDILLAKLNAANGAVVWKQIIGGTDDDNGLDLKIDAANNLYLNGNFGSPSITFPNGTTFTNPDDPNDALENSTNSFIAKFDQNGVNSWVKTLDNTDIVGISQIAVTSAGDVYLTGYFLDSVTFPTAPTPTTLIETEGSGEDEESEGGYIAKMDASGNFVWAKEFGGIGEAITLDAAGRVYVAGKFFDGGTFGLNTANAESLASFGGEDLFAARYDANGGFDWAKPIAGSSQEGEIVIGSPAGATENNYNPLGIAFNPASNSIFVSGDLRGTVSLDCITLTANGTNQSYLAELSQDNEAVSCRIWNGLDADDNNWDSPDNWNGGIIPADNDSVYVPYTGNSFDNPTYNPAGFGSILNNLTISDDRTLTLNRDLVLTGKLWLLGGFVNTGADRLLDLTDTATANRIADATGNGGYVIGKIRKEFGNTNPFIFPVGTANGYSPVDVNPQFGIGALLAVKAVQQPQPMFANSANRINRYWNINKAGKGFIEANLTFHYLQTDVVGNESQLVVFKVEDGEAMQQSAIIDTTENTATVNDVSQFSDWTLAQIAPTAAAVSVAGRILTPDGRGLRNARVTLTDLQGNTRTAISNSFGYYRFTEIAAGQTYIFTVNAKSYQFAPQVVAVAENREDLNFAAQ